ncbi:MAG: DUF3052 domain-containing protein [Pseudomonadota bacterium]
MPTTHGYSGKPLYQKLGLKPGMKCLTVGAPAHYPELVEGAEGVRFQKRAVTADVVHLFCPTRRVLDNKIEQALAKVVDGGMLWISWPKKSSRMFKDLTEDQLREVILPTGWVDVKVCAVDADWSGLKFVRRKTKR